MITVNGDKFPWHDGMTVARLLAEKNYKFRLISVWVNDCAVEKRLFDRELIPDGANVQVIHNISGG